MQSSFLNYLCSPTLLLPTLLSQFVVREITNELEELCDTALEYVKRHDPTAPVEAFNSVVFLAYYDKTGAGKSLEQLRFHRDQRWSRQGKFLTKLNSQKKTTATCVLTLGDTRKLHMQCFKDNFTKDGTGSIKIKKLFASELFSSASVPKKTTVCSNGTCLTVGARSGMSSNCCGCIWR